MISILVLPSQMRAYFDSYEDLMAENLPALYEHFKQMEITSDLYVIDWYVRRQSLSCLWYVYRRNRTGVNNVVVVLRST